MASKRYRAKRPQLNVRKRLRKWLIETYGDGRTVACVHCGKRLNKDNCTLDRIKPGGVYDHSNVQAACARCNNLRGNDEDWRLEA